MTIDAVISGGEVTRQRSVMWLAPSWRHVIAGDIWRDDKRGAWSKHLDRRSRAKRDRGLPRGVERPASLARRGRVESRPEHRMESARSGT